VEDTIAVDAVDIAAGLYCNLDREKTRLTRRNYMPKLYILHNSSQMPHM
jgi:hypothetical protein